MCSSACNFGSDSISMKFADGIALFSKRNQCPISFRISALVPVGLIVESLAQPDDSFLVTARAGIQAATCPLCGSPARRVHSRYVREVSDLPGSGRSVRLQVVTRRFRCDAPHCRRQIFAERFGKTVVCTENRNSWRRRRAAWQHNRRAGSSCSSKIGGRSCACSRIPRAARALAPEQSAGFAPRPVAPELHSRKCRRV
jgi:zinc-finger of transposase IS204/IS1001/IS1096/IS1165